MNKLLLISRNRIIYDGQFVSVKMKLTTGEILILNNHAPMIGEIAEGNLFYITDKNEKIEINCQSGFIIITKEIVKISLVEKENARK